MGISKNHSISYDIGNNYEPLTHLCLVVYATKGATGIRIIATTPKGISWEKHSNEN